MKIDDLGIPIFDDKSLENLIYSGYIDKIHTVLTENSDNVSKFNDIAKDKDIGNIKLYEKINVDKKLFDQICQSNWLMPESYNTIDIKEFILKKLPNSSPSSIEYRRAMEELDEFEKRNMFSLLRYIIFLVDFMKEKNIVWGVGRGSSVSSYVLFLIGIHRIDSIKYSLDWKEFLR